MPKKVTTFERKQNESDIDYLRRISKTANQRILRIERKVGKKDTWGVKTLKKDLDTLAVSGWTKKGRIRLSKKMTEAQVKATIKHTLTFLKSKASTTRGIEDIKKKTIESITLRLYGKHNLKDLTNEQKARLKSIDYEEAQVLYSIFDDKDSRDIMQYVPSSAFSNMIEDARKSGRITSEEKLQDYFKSYIYNVKQDKDLMRAFTGVYNKYFRGLEGFEAVTEDIDEYYT